MRGASACRRIALSIAFLAAEILRARRGQAGIAARAPWLVAFASFTGKPIDREYAETRKSGRRLYEATQIKGDGEFLS